MNNLKLIALLIIIISMGCRPLKNLTPATYKIEPINKNEFTKLNGRYKNIQDTVFGKIEHYPGRGIDENNKGLLDRLFIFYPNNVYNKETTVEINFISNKKATISAYQNGAFLFTKTIRGKFKKNYFYVRPKVFIIPFFPVFYWHNFERVRIGKIGNDIILDHTLNSWAFVLIAGGSDSGFSTSIYKRWTE
jgi:hypothetical protein